MVDGERRRLLTNMRRGGGRTFSEDLTPSILLAVTRVRKLGTRVGGDRFIRPLLQTNISDRGYSAK